MSEWRGVVAREEVGGVAIDVGATDRAQFGVDIQVRAGGLRRSPPPPRRSASRR